MRRIRLGLCSVAVGVCSNSSYWL